jgi:Protein of unknown function (DUF1189)
MKTFFEKFKLIVVDKSFGASIKVESIGKSMRFLLYVMLFIGSVMMIKAEMGMYQFSKVATEKLGTKFPNFELKDGRFICEGAMPFVYNAKDILFIIDTSGKTNSSLLNGFKEGIIITETNIFYKKSASETRSYELNEFSKFNITKGRLIELINDWTVPSLVILFIFCLFFIYVWKLIGVLTLSVIALIINKILKTNLEYQDLFKMSVYAIILPSIIDSGLGIVEVNIPYFWIVYYAIAGFFLVQMMQGTQQITEEETV